MFDCIRGIRRDYGFGRAIAAPQIGIQKRLNCMLTDKPYVIINPTLEFVGDKGKRMDDVSVAESQAFEPKDLTILGHNGDLLYM